MGAARDTRRPGDAARRRPGARRGAGCADAVGRSRPLRWAAAIAVVTLVLGATLAVAALLTGGTTQASVLRYVPQDTVVYGELRLDLPGDQRQAVAEFLSKFPGFADQAALESKIDETLDRLLGEASRRIPDLHHGHQALVRRRGRLQRRADLGRCPSGEPAAASAPRALLLISVKDQAAASAWFGDLLSEGGVPTTTETYQGVELTVVSPGAEVFDAGCRRVRDPRRQRRRPGRPRLGQGGDRHRWDQSLASDPEFEAAEPRPTATTSGSPTSTCRP